jgi:hypothetical protein
MNEIHLRLSEKEGTILLLHSKLVVAKALTELGARTTIVASVCGISKKSAINLHKEIFGESPKAGQLPYDEDWLFKSPSYCFHASIFANIYQHLKDNTHALSKAELYVQAYRLYEETLPDAIKRKKILDINRAWHILQQIHLHQLTPKSCPTCRSTYLSIRNFPEMYKLCPVCNIESDALGREKWKCYRLRVRRST